MPLPPTGVTEAEVNFLRKLTRDPDFRAAYFDDPAAISRAEGIRITESTLIGNISPSQIDGLYRAANAVGQARADDNCTLVYALAFAVAFALLV